MPLSERIIKPKVVQHFDRKHNKTHAQPSQDENEYENIISPYLLVRVTLEIIYMSKLNLVIKQNEIGGFQTFPAGYMHSF